jgi:monoamine oxidase
LNTSNPSATGSVSGLTRRRFLHLAGFWGGSAAVLSGMTAWGHMPASAQLQPPQLEGSGNGTRVIVLGAGPCGLTAAYELVQLGYDVTLLEARNRVGGHVFTVRRGSVADEIGQSPRVCDFDDGQFFDAGAWRIPYTHSSVLYYCRLFNIPLVVHTNLNMNAYVHYQNIDGPLAGKPVRVRELIMDMEGYTAELLAAGLSQGKLDDLVTEEDREAFLDYIIAQGLLDEDDLTYGNNSGRGWATLAGGGYAETTGTDPYPMRDILPLGVAATDEDGGILFHHSLLTQPVMLRPANGMSQIYEDGFERALSRQLIKNAAVTDIRQTPDEVRVAYRDTVSGDTREVTGDYIINTITASLLLRMGETGQTDFAGSVLQALSNISYGAVGKLGLQFKRRFWEEDEGIYGGITFTDNDDISNVFYPSWNYGEQKGVIQAYYSSGVPAMWLSSLTQQERIDVALDYLAQIHPQAPAEYETGFAVAWHKERYSLGGSPSFAPAERGEHFATMLEPDGRIFFAGAYLSQLTGWMQGAIEAAWIQVEALHQRAQSS